MNNRSDLQWRTVSQVGITVSGEPGKFARLMRILGIQSQFKILGVCLERGREEDWRHLWIWVNDPGDFLNWLATFELNGSMGLIPEIRIGIQMSGSNLESLYEVLALLEDQCQVTPIFLYQCTHPSNGQDSVLFASFSKTDFCVVKKFLTTLISLPSD